MHPVLICRHLPCSVNNRKGLPPKCVTDTYSITFVFRASLWRRNEFRSKIVRSRTLHALTPSVLEKHPYPHVRTLSTCTAPYPHTCTTLYIVCTCTALYTNVLHRIHIHVLQCTYYPHVLHRIHMYCALSIHMYYTVHTIHM